MMKKFSKFLGSILAIAILVFTPSVATVSQRIMTMAVTDNVYHHAAPAGNSQLFTESSVTVMPLTEWQANPGNHMITQQVTAANNDEFIAKNSHNNQYLLSDAGINGYSPIVMTNDDSQLGTNGYYTCSAITLPANGYYRVSVDYFVNGDNATFYLNDDYIVLSDDHNWHTSTFYIHTDRLATANITPELYFGSRNMTNAKGATYFDRFTITAIREGVYENEITNVKSNQKVLDLAQTDDAGDDDIVLLQTYHANDFEPAANTASSRSLNRIHSTAVPSLLRFEDTENFYTKDGEGNVMLMVAENGRTDLTVEEDFAVNPHEVYMFQFYSIASPELSNFYLRIDDTYQSIETVSDAYPYYNGWQLNTVFYIAGHDTVHEHTFGFVLGHTEDVTGWVAIDPELKIYQVSGHYATDHENAAGVHNINDLNTPTTTPTIANAYFELGTASDLNCPSYPYPLKADDWTIQNGNDNGIVNPAFWYFGSLENPGKNDAVVNYDDAILNNNIYMIRNAKTPADGIVNTLTSPLITTSKGAATYISFDAFGKTSSQTRANLTTEDGILLGSMEINDNAWHHYEFKIVESEFAADRQYYLTFTMTGAGATYLDNIHSSDKAFDFATETATTQTTIDLTNILNVAELWTADVAESYDCLTYRDGSIKFVNQNQANVTIKHNFAYTLEADQYYLVTVTARGENAYLGLSGFDGNVTVITDEIDPETSHDYKLYFKANTDTTSANFTITLGSLEADVHTDSNLYITKITTEKIEAEAYDLVVNADNDQIAVLTPTNATEEEPDESDQHPSNNFFGENWWYLVPTLITAIAAILAVICYFMRKIKFDRHITTKTASYARDVKIKNDSKKIVAEKAAKVDNVTDETSAN